MPETFDPHSAFTVAAARDAGFTRRDLDQSFLDTPFRGLRAVHSDDTEGDISPAQRQRAAIVQAAERFAAGMTAHEFFSHTTAAALWGIPLPTLPDDDIHVAAFAPHRARRGAGVHGHQLAARAVVLVRHPDSHVALTTPSSTWALLGAVLWHPYDLVAAADGVLHVDRIPGPHGRVKSPALGTIADLAAAIPGHRRGVRALRAALLRARAGVASRTETWTRLIIVDAGMPEPHTDVEVFSRGGVFIGCVDLAYPQLRIAIEYEGDQHRTSKAQWNRDLEKYDALARAGWIVIRVSADQLFRRPERLVASVRAALASRTHS